MLIHASASGRGVAEIKGDAHIVLSVLANGTLCLSAYRQGDFSTMYAAGDDGLLSKIAPLLQELRNELAHYKV